MARGEALNNGFHEHHPHYHDHLESFHDECYRKPISLLLLDHDGHPHFRRRVPHPHRMDDHHHLPHTLSPCCMATRIHGTLYRHTQLFSNSLREELLLPTIKKWRYHPMKKPKHFTDATAYHDYLAYEHIHHLQKPIGPYPAVYIKGKKQSVKH